MIEILKMLVAPLIGLIGVFVGSRLKMKSDIEIQKEFLAREIKINKLQEITEDMTETLIEVASLNSLFNQRLHRTVTSSKLNEHQERIANLYLGISVKLLFVNREYKERIIEFYRRYDKSIDEIKIRTFKEEIFPHFSDENRHGIEEYQKNLLDIVSDLNRELLKELKALQVTEGSFFSTFKKNMLRPKIKGSVETEIEGESKS